MDTHDDLKNDFGTFTSEPAQQNKGDLVDPDAIGTIRMAKIRSLITRRMLYVCYGGLFLLTFVVSLEINLSYALLPSALASFTATALTSVLSITTSLLDIVLVPLYSKGADYFGRLEAFSVALVFYLIGLIITSTSTGFSSFAAGWAVTALGVSGYQIVKLILIADLTSLADRATFLALDNLPFALNNWVGALAATPLEKALGWRWGYGIPAILLIPGASLILVILFRLQNQAKVSSQMHNKNQQGLSFKEKMITVVRRIDLIGFVLLVGSLMMIMLPMVIAGTLPDGWATPSMIALEVIGVVLLATVGVYEWKYASHPLIPIYLLGNPTTIGAIILYFFIKIDAGMNWQYFPLYFMISRKIDQTASFLLFKGYQMAYMISAILTGLLLKRLSDYKRVLIIGAIINCVGIGLMIPARFPHSSDVLIVVTQAICGIGNALVDMSAMVALQGSVSRKNVAIITATNQIIGSIGSSIGSTIAGIIWTQLVPKLLSNYVTGPFDLTMAMGDYNYVWELPDKQFEQAVRAFGEGQMAISAVSCFSAGLAFLVAVFIMKSIDIQNTQKFNEDDEMDIRADSDAIPSSSLSKP